MTIKAYIVEDHDDMRLLLKWLLKRNIDNIEVCGEADSEEKAIKEIPEIKPELILVDLRLPGIGGLQLVKEIRLKVKNSCIVVVTGYEPTLYRDEALEAGADEIVSKVDLDQVIKTIKAVLKDHLSGKG